MVLTNEVKRARKCSVPASNRTYTAWTTRLLAEWIAINLPRASVQNEVKLGPLDTSGISGVSERIAAGVASNKRGRIDALAWDADYIYLIEAKAKLDGAALGQIENYLRLLPGTAELQSLMGRTVRPILLCAIDDVAVHGEASARAIEVVIYHPAWLDAAQTKVQAQQAANVAQLEPGAPGTGRTSVRRNVGIVGGT